MFDINKFLQDREDRVLFQESLIAKYKLPMLTVRTNYPGENKRELIADNIADIISDEIEIVFDKKIIIKEIIENLEGKIYLFIIDEKAEIIKKQSISIEENHILGRCVDIDVYDTLGNGISRSIFNLGKRKCMLCDELAFVCGRTMKHSHEEIKEFITNQYIKYQEFLKEREKVANNLSDIALESMIYEVSSYPSFGLVSPLTQGAHNDMDFFTFLDSSFAIKEGLKSMAKISYSSIPLDIVFNHLREIGKITEKNMFIATNNINTHKGMIFLLGVVISATARALYEKKSFNEIQNIIKNMTKDILKDFDNINPNSNLTHGEKLFLKYGFTGIRGEIKTGLEVIFNGAIKVFTDTLEKTKSTNLASVQTLIFLMGNVMDSTIVYRHDFETLERVKKEMQELYHQGGIFIQDSQSILKDIEKKYISNRISPGGCADLLAITLFFFKVLNKNYFSF